MLKFYNVADVPNKLNKTLTQLGSTAYFKATDGNSETQTTYILDAAMPANTNYIYDTELGKYFFIVEVEHYTAKRIAIHCALDALQTYKDRLTGIFYFVRGASKPTEMDDNCYPLSDYIKTETYYFEDWDNEFFRNDDGGYHFMLRTAVGKPRAFQIVATLNVDSLFYNGKKEYKVLTVTDDRIVGGFIGGVESPGTPQISVGDYVQSGDIVYRCDLLEPDGQALFRASQK